MSIKQDQATTTASEGAETVTVTVSLESTGSPVAWQVTFLSHLEVSEEEPELARLCRWLDTLS